MAFDLGKVGRSYLIALWAGFAVLCVVAVVVGTWRQSRGEFGSLNAWEVWVPFVLLLAVGLVHGASAWGIVRRRRWSYYLSLGISLYWILASAYSMTTAERMYTNVPLPLLRWIYGLFAAAGALALAWLITPAVRSQFSAAMQEK